MAVHLSITAKRSCTALNSPMGCFVTFGEVEMQKLLGLVPTNAVCIIKFVIFALNQ